MMMAATYVVQIVEPTLEEFRQCRVDLRRGMLASMAVLHVVDFVMQNREATPEAGEKAVGAFKRRITGHASDTKNSHRIRCRTARETWEMILPQGSPTSLIAH